MSEEERRQKAREATRAWKERHPFQVKQQAKRRWARIKEALRGPAPMTQAVMNTGIHGYIGKREKREVQETHYVPLAEVEGYMEPEQKGGHERTGKRVLSGATDERDTGEVRSATDNDVGLEAAPGGSGAGDKRTANEERTYAKLARMIERQKKRRGVEVDLKL